MEEIWPGQSCFGAGGRIRTLASPKGHWLSRITRASLRVQRISRSATPADGQKGDQASRSSISIETSLSGTLTLIICLMTLSSASMSMSLR